MSGWRLTRLKDVGAWYGGGTPSKSRAEFWDGGTVPWLSPKDMGDDVVHLTRDHITHSAVSGSAVKVVPPGSVAIVVRSGILERTVPIALVPFETTLNQDMKAISAREGIDPRWVAWWLRSEERQILSLTRKAGTTVASLETARLQEMLLPVPPLDEQRRIVDILEDRLSRLDAAARSLSEATARRRTLAAKLLDALVPDSAPLIPLRDLASSSGYGTSTKCVVGGPGAPVVRIPNLADGSIDLSDEKRVADASVDVSRLMLAPGDLLVVRTNGSRDLIGRTAVVQDGIEASFASYLIRYQLDEARVRPEWVHSMFARPAGRASLEGLAASSAGQYNLSLGKLDRIAIPLPSLSEQDALLGAVHVALDQLDVLAQSIEVALSRSSSLRQALLAAAFSGRLTGRSSDLERIEELVS